MSPPYVVINADDFGISETVNREIVRCFSTAAISSTTIMANEPSFDEAIALAEAHGFSDCIGVHLNLSHGRALSDVPASLRRADGTLAFPRRRTWAPGADLESLHRELSAQVGRVVAAGIQPTHFDSHEHWVNSLPYTRVALDVARKFGVRWIRPARNWLYRPSLMKTGFKVVYNSYLRRAGVMGVRRFTDFKDFLEHSKTGGTIPAGGVELMCHPAAWPPGSVQGDVLESDLLESAAFRTALTGANLISYRQIPAR